MSECPFILAWVGPCKEPVKDGAKFCAKHAEMCCVMCGKQAVQECSYSGQFVCGAPLCETCNHHPHEKKWLY